MKLQQDIESWIALCLIDGLGDESIRRLLVAFGSPAEIFTASTRCAGATGEQEGCA